MKKGFIFFLALFTCFMVVGCGKKVSNGTGDNNGTGNNNGTENGNGTVSGEQLKNSYKSLELKKDHEQYKFNNLTLDFYGEDVSKETGVENSYRYVLTLDLGGVEINSNIYSNPFKRLINSSNLASSFVIYAVDDIYILKSNVGAQIDGENALFFDKNGNFIDSFEDISIDIDIAKRTINYENCITTDPEENCIKRQYKISNNTIK